MPKGHAAIDLTAKGSVGALIIVARLGVAPRFRGYSGRLLRAVGKVQA